MNVIKKIASILLAVLFAVLLIAPIGALYFISKAERSKYTEIESIELKSYSYGEPRKTQYRSISKTVTIPSGTVISNAIDFIELGKYFEKGDIRFVISVGDYLSEGGVIGYLNGKPITAEKRGIVRDIGFGSDGYIMLDSVDELALECYVEESSFDWLEEDLELTDDKNEIVYTVLSYEPVNINSMGMRLLLVPKEGGLVYGATFSSIRLKTPRVYKNVLTIESNCVYSYPGSSEHYIRLVTEKGEFIEEKAIEVGYTNGEYTCISGNDITDGLYCDPGYKFVIQGGDEYYE